MGPGLPLRGIRKWVVKTGDRLRTIRWTEIREMMLASPIGRLPDPIAEQFRRCGLNVMRWQSARMKVAARQDKEAEARTKELAFFAREPGTNIRR